MEFKNFIKIWAVLLIILVVVVIGQVTNKGMVSNVILMGCEDYTYNMEFNTAPVNMIFYTTDNGVPEIFKTDYTIENKFSTILHCGHKYKAVYSAEGYKDYTEEFEVGKYIKINLFPQTTKLESELKEIILTK